MSAESRSSTKTNETRLEAADALEEAREAVDDQDSKRLEAAALAQLAIARQTMHEGWD